ncbi:MAG TPA: response regulator transcription factor [Kineosporiaceae bacterium]
MARVMLVEDDQRIGPLVVSALRDHGHEATWSTTGKEAIEVARNGPLDLVLLDLGLPDIDGIDVCRVLRAEQPDVVIVMLTARGEDMDVIIGLESGADDYITKPFGMTVLQARVRAHLRRLPDSLDVDVYRSGDLDISPGARRCAIAGVEVPLRAKQFELLERLARDLGRAVARDTLMADVWDENWFGSTKTLDVHIATLRQRLAAVAAQAAVQAGRPLQLPQVVTVRGVGYMLEPADRS